jgi:hypothetical protein
MKIVDIFNMLNINYFVFQVQNIFIFLQSNLMTLFILNVLKLKKNKNITAVGKYVILNGFPVIETNVLLTNMFYF